MIVDMVFVLFVFCLIVMKVILGDFINGIKMYFFWNFVLFMVFIIGKLICVL